MKRRIILELLDSAHHYIAADLVEHRFYQFNPVELKATLDLLIAENWIFEDEDGNIHLNMKNLKTVVLAALGD